MWIISLTESLNKKKEAALFETASKFLLIVSVSSLLAEQSPKGQI